MATFSWTDGVHAAVASCLPCFSSRSEDESNTNEHGRQGARTRPILTNAQRRLRASHIDELEGLLGDVLVESDADAETMSLHSNFGGGDSRGGRRKPKKKKSDGRTKHIRVFGYDLFGRPPIQLPESEDEGSSSGPRRGNRRVRKGQTPGPGSMTAASSSTEAFDSDAAPLDPSTLDQLSPQDALRLAQAAQREQEALEAEVRRQREEKEERRQKRRAKRELRRAAMGIGMADAEFEGFQGSGPDLPAGGRESPISSTVASSVAGEAAEPFGPFVGGQIRAGGGSEEDDDAGLADFGGGAYAHKSRQRNSNSDGSRSVTSASRSNPDSAAVHNHLFLSQAQVHPQTLADLPRKKKSKKSASRPSNSPTSQSASLPSPIDSPVDFDRRFSHPEPHVVIQGQSQVVQPMILSPSAQFEGFPQGSATSGFPSTGFKGVRRKSVDASAFLAM